MDFGSLRFEKLGTENSNLNFWILKLKILVFSRESSLVNYCINVVNYILTLFNLLLEEASKKRFFCF